MYYSGNKILKSFDINNQKPELYIVCSNRSDGKTTFFTKHLIDNFINNNKKFGLIYRYKNELPDCGAKFFDGVQPLFYQNYVMEQKPIADGLFYALTLNSKHCGVAVALSRAGKLKNYSHMFADIDCLFFDEYQSEDSVYLPKEVDKFISLHISMARGGGSQVRYLPVIMCSNFVNIINPYFVALGISKRLRSDTKLLKGNGFVLEQHHNQKVADLQEKSGFNRAFAGQQYLSSSIDNQYLLNNTNLIGYAKGGSFIITLLCDNVMYGVKLIDDTIYITTKYDKSKPVYSCDAQSHNNNTDFIKFNKILSKIKKYYAAGKVLCQDQNCKNVVLKIMMV